MENWNNVYITPEFCDQGVDCYRLNGDFLNDYYIVSEAETRKLMNHPEVVGYEVYTSLVTATSQMMYFMCCPGRWRAARTPPAPHGTEDEIVCRCIVICGTPALLFCC